MLNKEDISQVDYRAHQPRVAQQLSTALTTKVFTSAQYGATACPGRVGTCSPWSDWTEF